MKDFYSDYGYNFIKILKDKEVPSFVKEADILDQEEMDKLPDTAFASVDHRKLPITDPANVYVSAAYYFNANEKNAEVEDRILKAAELFEISEEIKTHIAEELNILKLDGIHVAEADLVDVSVKANFRTLGTKFGADVQIIAKAITSANHTEMVKHLRDNKSFKLAVDLTNGSKSAEIDIDDLVVTETPRTGWSVASHAGESLALDLALTPELIQSGLVREVIRAIQEERKKIGLDVSDRITVNWNAPDQVATAITSAVAEISAEVLATTLVQDKGQSSDGNELGLWLNLVKN